MSRSPSRNHPHNGPLMCIGPGGPGAMKQDHRGPTMMHCTARQPKTSRSMHLQRTQPWNGIHGRLRPTSRCKAK